MERKQGSLKGEVLQKASENAMEEVLQPHFHCFPLSEDEGRQKIAGEPREICLK